MQYKLYQQTKLNIHGPCPWVAHVRAVLGEDRGWESCTVDVSDAGGERLVEWGTTAKGGYGTS